MRLVYPRRELCELTAAIVIAATALTGCGLGVRPPGDAAAANDYDMKGLRALHAERYHEAIRYLTVSIQLNPGNGSTYGLRGLAYSKLQPPQWRLVVSDMTMAI